MSQPTRVLSLQPYFGGSHAQFHRGWANNSQHQWTTLTLPPRHWKWRMRHASIHFTKLVRELTIAGNQWDVIFCSDMLNVAEFKGLIASDNVLASNVARLPIVVYFHENQFAYPTRQGFQPDQHFPFINFISALTADQIWFNSRFNFDSMLAGLKRHARRWPDFVPVESIDSLESRAEIQPPGIESPPLNVADFRRQRVERAANKEPIRIVWAARWEHDKNAEDLLAALKILSKQGVSFKLSVLGQSFRRRPPAFDELRSMFDSQILRWGFQETRQQYWESLAESDVFVSTAKHEFFGLSAAESIAAGLTPLFPNRLAYPELLQYACAIEDEGSSENRKAKTGAHTPADAAAFAPEKTDPAPTTNTFSASEGGATIQAGKANIQAIHDDLYDGTAAGLARTLQKIHQSRLDGRWTNDPQSAMRIVERLNWNQRASELDQALSNAVNEMK